MKQFVLKGDTIMHSLLMRDGQPTQRARDEAFVLAALFDVLDPLDTGVVMYDRIIARLTPDGAAQPSLYREAVKAVQRADDAGLALAVQFIHRAREIGSLPPSRSEPAPEGPPDREPE